MAVSYKVKLAITILTSNCIHGHLSQKMKTYVHKTVYTQMFIAALFVIIQNGKKSADVLQQVNNKINWQNIQTNTTYKYKKSEILIQRKQMDL